MKARHRSVRFGAIGIGIASMVVMLAASPAFAFAEPYNTVTPYNPWPAETTCVQYNEYGEYIFTAYASEDIISNNGCVAGIVQDVYDSGGTLHNGDLAFGTNTDYWYEASDPYQTIFGANLAVEYWTRDYGEVSLYYGVTPYG